MSRHWSGFGKTSHLVVLLVLLVALTTAATAYARMGGMGGMGGGMCGGGGMGMSALTGFSTADFSGSGVCSSCHDGLFDGQGRDVSIGADWGGTTMANAARDPLWQAKISSEIQRHPGLAEAIEDKCTRCHMGMGRYQAVTDGSPVKVFGAGFVDPNHPLHQAAMDGVSCTLCHQIQPRNLGSPESFTGHYEIDTSTNPPNRFIFGPFNQPFGRMMASQAGFVPVGGTQIMESELCGTCHMLYTPVVDGAGKVIGEFPEQTTWLEWRHAVANGGGGQTPPTCRSCHMPQAAGAVVLSNWPHHLPARFPFMRHQFTGGNGFMLEMLKVHGGELGVTAAPAHFGAALSETDHRLRTGTADLEVKSASINQAGRLEAVLSVRNKTGHKFPTGIPIRRAWLHVTVEDGAGRTVFESGAPLPDGRIAGNDADADPAAYEPHYDQIESPDQVQVYETIMADSDGDLTWTLLRAYAYAKDNRLTPFGFDKSSAPADAAVHGSASDDGNFNRGYDRVVYRVDVGAAIRPLIVKARLLYQPVAWRFVEDLRQDGGFEVNRFAGMYDAADKSPKVVAEAEVSVQ